MASRILLISANRCTTPDPVFPLGLAHLGSALRQAGHTVRWLDLLADEAGLEEILESWRPNFVGISLRNVDDVLIRKREVYYDGLSSLGANLRELGRCPVILGGSGFSIYPERLLELSGADYGICGEGEAGLVALIAALERGSPVDSIPGLVYRRAGRVLVNPRHGRSPDWGLHAVDRPASVTAHYLQTSGVLNVQTQRGCGFRCSYCTYPLIEGRQHRGRPPEHVAEEFEQLQGLGARYAFIVDSIFNSSARHVTEMCEAILRRNVKLSWGCFLRPQGLTPELMRLMARAGLSHIEFGSDSFCDSVLEEYRKDFTFADVVRSTELARAENVDCCHFLICGGPGETLATLEAGFRNSRQLSGAVIMAVVGMRVYPGTHLYQRAVAEGCLTPEADLLEPVYYLARGLTAEGVFARLQAFSRLSPSWIVGDPDPVYTRLVERLRQRGVMGPLWSYFAMIQRLWPQGVSKVQTP